MYMITHKHFDIPKGADAPFYIPLHVGRKLGTDLGYQGDDTGEEISEKNRTFCELTGLYWIWKNVSCDIVGIAHYRRFFIHGSQNDIMSGEMIEQALKDHDILLSISCFTQEESVYDHYQKWHHLSDLKLCRQVISELCPKDLDAFDLAMRCRLFSGGNLFAASKKIFDDYCGWLFPILFEVEKRADISGYDDYQKRLYGFLAERLLRVFVMGRGFRIKETEVGQIQ
ncbi:MAG: DUF4422 domain-containing protein [Lachnospiraceae bacterium]|nr:DUF4422 domain-containing protein [Lachnospiraceae bacterium]